MNDDANKPLDSYDNPAGRLYELLRQLNDVGKGTSISVAWAQVLGVDEDEVPLRLGSVVELVGEIRQAVQRPGAGAFAATVDRYRATWTNAIFPTSQSFNEQVVNVRPDDVALEALAGVAAHLHAIAPEGKIPDEHKLEDLKDKVRGVLVEVEGAEEIPDEVRDLFVSRLSGVLQALEHIAIGGPNAIRLASEALAGAIVIQEGTGKVRRTKTVRNLLSVLGIVWFTFTAAPTAQRSLEAWEEVIHGQLTPAQTAGPEKPEQAAPPADRPKKTGSGSPER
jgi:hypothetical protein